MGGRKGTISLYASALNHSLVRVMEMAVEKLDTLQSVELAEGVEIRLRIAGPMLRIGAYLLDMLIQWLTIFAIAIALSLSGFVIAGEVAWGLGLLILFVINWWYPVFFEASKWGATPGKRVVGLRVAQTSGAPITMGQAIIRNFLRVVDALPGFTYGFGLASCLATRRFQRLGDLAAGTVVIYDRIPPEPGVHAPPPLGKVIPPVPLTADEIRSIATFRERAGLWSEARRVEIADHIAELSGTRGPGGVNRVMSMAHWLQEKRES
jgi:uncharacterized RDD family membrane protein YckC